MNTVATKSRGRPRSAETEQVILDTAYRIMATSGLAASSIDAIARASGVSKMTIYKWWPSREALLIDAFLRQAASMLPLLDSGDALAAIRKHAAAYAVELNGDFGRVQLAVIAECISQTGSANTFTERYLAIRRQVAVGIIQSGQASGSIAASEPAEDLYDRIYGTLFYQNAFGLRSLTRGYAERLVTAVLSKHA